MSYVVELELQGLPRIITNGSQGSWKSTHYNKKRWKRLVGLAVGYRKPDKPLESVKIECVRCSFVRPDRDNLAASFKACLDGLVECGVIADDTDDVIKEINYSWEKAPMRAGKVRIRVEEIA